MSVIPDPDRGWRVRVLVELSGNRRRWDTAPPLTDKKGRPARGLTYSVALALAVDFVRSGLRARLVAPDGSEGRDVPRAYAVESSGRNGPLFDGGRSM